MGEPLGMLPVPPAATRDLRSLEMIRAWVAENGLHCSVRVHANLGNGTVADETAWGIVLADVIRHVADAHHKADGKDRGVMIAAIAGALQAELERPSSGTDGAFVRDDDCG